MTINIPKYPIEPIPIQESEVQKLVTEDVCVTVENKGEATFVTLIYPSDVEVAQSKLLNDAPLSQDYIQIICKRKQL